MSTRDKQKWNEYIKEYSKRGNFKQLKINVKPADYETIDNYCKMSNISKAKFIVKCCKYCINHDINFDD